MNKNERKSEYFYEFGNIAFGPILLSFSKWLLNSLKEKKINKVYFFARDGFVMKQAFDIINDDENIKSYYFYASRRSIIVPSLWTLNSYDEIFDSIAFSEKITLKSFLKKIGLDDLKIEYVCENYGIEDNKTYSIQEIRKNSDFMSNIFPLVVENSKKEWESFKSYISSIDFKDKVAIVDIGWNGTMQRAIEKLLPEVDINGYYMCLVPKAEIYDPKKYHGFISDCTHDEELYNKLYFFISIFEFMFLAQHGSVKRFADSSKMVELYEYEYENTEEKEYAQKLQSGAIQFVEKEKSLDFSNYEAMENIYKILLSPKLYDAKAFGDLLFLDNDVEYIAKPKKLGYYIFHFNDFKQDIRRATWKIGFLKRLFKIKLPYFKIANFFKNKS